MASASSGEAAQECPFTTMAATKIALKARALNVTNAVVHRVGLRSPSNLAMPLPPPSPRESRGRIPPATARLRIVDSATKKIVRNRRILSGWSVLAEEQHWR